jgi:hypothetical protein
LASGIYGFNGALATGFWTCPPEATPPSVETMSIP